MKLTKEIRTWKIKVKYDDGYVLGSIRKPGKFGDLVYWFDSYRDFYGKLDIRFDQDDMTSRNARYQVPEGIQKAAVKLMRKLTKDE